MDERTSLLNQLQIDHDDKAHSTGRGWILWGVLPIVIIAIGAAAWLYFYRLPGAVVVTVATPGQRLDSL